MKYLSLPLVVACGFASAPLAAQEKLEEIIVIASRVETPLREVGASVSVIDQSEIQLRGYPTVGELLRTQPGVAMTNTGGAGKQSALRIRGEEGFRTLIMIDGVEVSDPSGTQVMSHVEHLTTGSEIERVEVLRGPQGFVYGADAGGVVQIFTRAAEQGTAGQVSAEAGRYGSRRLGGFVATANNIADAFISITDWQTDGFNAVVADISGEADGYENTTLHGKFGWNPSADSRVQLVVRDVSGENRYDSCFGLANCVGGTDQVNDVAQTTAKLSLDHKSDALAHHLALSQTDVEREYSSNGSPNYVTDGQIKKAEYVGQYAATEYLDLVFGGDGKIERVQVADGEDLSRFQLGLFGEAQLGIADRLFFTGGLRYDDNQDFGEHVSARITSAFVQALNDESSIKLRASAGNGFRAPSLQEIAFNQNSTLPTPALAEESSSGYDLGVEYFRASGLSAEISWFEQSIKDEIVFDRVTFSRYLQADGRSHSKGVEVQFAAPMSRWAQLQASFTRNLTQTADDLPRIRRPGKFVNVSLYLYPQENVVLLLNNRWERDAVDGLARTPLDNYEVLDLSVNYEPVSNWEIFARVNNLLDENYQEVPGYNTSGRAAHVGARFTF